MKTTLENPPEITRSNADILRELATVYDTQDSSRIRTFAQIQARYDEFRQRLRNHSMDLCDIGVMVWLAKVHHFAGCV